MRLNKFKLVTLMGIILSGCSVKVSHEHTASESTTQFGSVTSPKENAEGFGGIISPKIYKIYAPSESNIQKGQWVTLIGEFFTPEMKIAISGVDCHGIRFDSSTKVSCVMSDTIYSIRDVSLSYSGKKIEFSFPFVILDNDEDGIENINDNCPVDNNEDQADRDGNGKGDACDHPSVDSDGDGTMDGDDNCLGDYNPDQTDMDGNEIGDLCDSGTQNDADGDLIPDSMDNCPNDFDPTGTDSDEDSIGDVCDE